jgi:CRISPR-associated protein Cmr3
MVFDEPRRLARLEPTTVPGVPAALLPKVAVLRQHASAKPAAGYWLEGSGLETYLLGELPTAVAATRTLYGRDLRLGIAIGSGSGTVEKGALYTTEAVALREGVGFLVGIDGLGELLPAEGTLRLGGDGRGARYTRIEPPATGRAINGERFRVVLATPAVFRDGWLPDGCVREADGSVWLRGAGFGARLVCASVGRHGVVSGWDIAARRPKDAQRVVPAGSVYWFEDLQGDVRKLATWVAGGLWDDTADPARRAEGFNLAWLGEWL